MTVSVVMSSATRVPGFSFALSTFVRQPTTYRGPLLAFTMTGATYVADCQCTPALAVVGWMSYRG